MSIEQSILEKLRTLRPEKQREVLDSIRVHPAKERCKTSTSQPEGLRADLGESEFPRKTAPKPDGRCRGVWR